MKLSLFIISLFCILSIVSCNKVEGLKESSKKIESITYHHPEDPSFINPIKTKYTYYNYSGLPQRWMEFDSSGKLLIDYLHQYNEDNFEMSALYKEPGDDGYSVERFSMLNDSTKLTEWIDSTGNVYYTMIDQLNLSGNTKRATFSDGVDIHGYDTTIYNELGFISRVYFNSSSGKILNDRSFNYDSINRSGDWIKRSKFFGDSLAEIQIKTLNNYDYISKDNIFYPGIISDFGKDENVISFTQDQSVAFFTRSKTWDHQSAYLATKEGDIYGTPAHLEKIGPIYNGSISPSGDQIIYCEKAIDGPIIWLIKKVNDQWLDPYNLTISSGIKGGYFNWIDEGKLAFYIPDNQGDIVLGELSGERLIITDSLTTLNTVEANEFSPYLNNEMNLLIFTRYQEGNEDQQGFFFSFKSSGNNLERWSSPEKIESLEYGWGGTLINNSEAFIYTDGENIKMIPFENLNISTDL